MNAASRVAVNTSILYAKMGVTVFISLYTTRLILAALGTSDFGIFNLVGGAIALLGFLNASMAGASQRFISFAQGAGEFNKLKQIFSVTLILHLMISALLILALEFVKPIFFNGFLTISPDRLYAARMIYQSMVVITVLNVISVPYDSVINAHENMLLFALLGIVEAVMKLIIAFLITYTTQEKLILYGVLLSILSLLLLSIRIIYCHERYKECQFNLRMHFSIPIFMEISQFAGWSFLGSFTSMVSNYGQGIVLNMFFGTIVNAAQGIASQVSGQLGAFAVTMIKALNPVITKSEGAKDRPLMMKASVIGSKVSFFLLVLFYVPILIEMPYIFNLWLKNVPHYTIVFCRLLLVRNLIEQLFITVNSAIAAVGNIRKYELYYSIITSLTLPISYCLFKLGFPPYIMYVVFIAYSVAHSVLSMRFAKSNFNLSIHYFFIQVVMRCITLFLMIMILSAIPIFLMKEGMQRLMITCFISITSYSVIVWLFGFSTEEKNSSKAIVKVIMDKMSSNKFIRKNFVKSCKAPGLSNGLTE